MRIAKRKLIFGLILFGVLFGGCYLLGGCYILKTPPARDCPIESLVLDESVFPGEAVAEPILSPLPRAAWESAGRGIFLKKGGGLIHDIYRYRTASRAAKEFEKRKQLTFVETATSGSWETPSEVTYRSPIADRYYLACGMEHKIYMCFMLAQYEEYYVFFNAHMSEKGMTFEALERALRAIDERMARCLGKPWPAEQGTR